MLPEIQVQKALPIPSLRPYVRLLVQRCSRPLVPPFVEPIVARLGAVLEFQFGDPYDVPIFGVERPNYSAPVAVIGTITHRSARIVIEGRVEALTILFQPLGFWALFQVPNEGLVDIGTPAEAVLGNSLARLHQQLGEDRTFNARVQRLEKFFLQQLRQHSGIDPALLALTQPDAPTVKDAACMAGVSVRQLERRCFQQTGVSPKAVTKMARFQRAFRLRMRGKSSWTEIAHACGYSDQMHMVRDFRAMASESPSGALAKVQPGHLVTMC